MIVQKCGEFLEHAQNMNSYVQWIMAPNQSLLKQKKKTLNSVTVCQYPLTQYPAFRRHCDMSHSHCSQNGTHGFLACNSFCNNGICRPAGCADAAEWKNDQCDNKIISVKQNKTPATKPKNRAHCKTLLPWKKCPRSLSCFNTHSVHQLNQTIKNLYPKRKYQTLTMIFQMRLPS